MNALSKLLAGKDKNLLSVYFTAGYPHKGSTVKIIHSLQDRGVDFAEVGFPFSDPLADGPVIQQTSQQAIKNGMNLDLLLDQLMEARSDISIPLILMGYLNPVLQKGMEAFCRRAAEAGISGLILPDLPPDEYEAEYKEMFQKHDLHMIFLVTPETSMERIRKIDKLAGGFIYAVSSSSTTGRQEEFSADQIRYLLRLKEMGLRNKVLVGFGIHNSSTLQSAWEYSNGAIIGTAFLRALIKDADEVKAIDKLYNQLGIEAG